MSDEDRKRNILFSVSFTWWWLCPRYSRASDVGVGVEVAKWREGMFHDERSFQKYGLLLGLHYSSAAFR